jgi:galactokinase
MDQFASSCGKKDSAIFLDTATLEYTYVPVKLDGAKIVIVNSKVKHSLVDSAYNERRATCEAALEKLQTVVDIKTLCDLKPEEFENLKYVLDDEIMRKRAKHAIYENARTIEAVAALGRNDLTRFGELMNESHVSLRDDYETSCEETDLLAEIAWSIDGVYGSRITGGGFGGCTVSIVKDEAIPEFKRRITSEYKAKTPEIYVVEIGDGAHAI